LGCHELGLRAGAQCSALPDLGFEVVERVRSLPVTPDNPDRRAETD
jgi:hypothetical protein